MGQILSQPITDKTSENGQSDRLIFGVSSMQGWRISMEDSHAAELDLKYINLETYKKDEVSAEVPQDHVSFFAVYDGHGGSRAAIYSGANLHHIVAAQDSFSKGNYATALKDGFLSTDKSLQHDPEFLRDPSGCTATTALITKNRIYVANAGDSRTVLGVKGIAKALSFDHKPQHEGERARICAAGGFVEAGRVNGNLALSRAIGDFEFKQIPSLSPEEQAVTASPDIMERAISPDDEFVVLACDGIWDCMHSQDVVEFVRRGIAEKQDLDYICENIMENCLAPASDMSGIGCDNMTIMIVGILNGKTKEEWYDMIATRVANGEGPAASVESVEPKSSSAAEHGSHYEPYSQGMGAHDLASQAFGGSLSLQQLLGENAIVTNENGVLVIQSSSEAAASLVTEVVDDDGRAKIEEADETEEATKDGEVKK